MCPSLGMVIGGTGVADLRSRNHNGQESRDQKDVTGSTLTLDPTRAISRRPTCLEPGYNPHASQLKMTNAPQPPASRLKLTEPPTGRDGRVTRPTCARGGLASRRAARQDGDNPR
jgi:hypothetical protein